MGGCELFKNLNFLMKFIAMVLLLVILLLCLVISDGGGRVIPVHSDLGLFLFYMALGGYDIILVMFVILYLLDEIPGTWALRIYVVVGFVLLILTGIIGFLEFNHLAGSDNKVLRAIVCGMFIASGVLLIVDFVKESFL